jgi:hypothetical protein
VLGCVLEPLSTHAERLESRHRDRRHAGACIVPQANGLLTKETDILKNCLSHPYRERVSIRYLEDLGTALEETIPADPDRMKEHFRLFREKYLPGFSAEVRQLQHKKEG